MEKSIRYLNTLGLEVNIIIKLDNDAPEEFEKKWEKMVNLLNGWGNFKKIFLGRVVEVYGGLGILDRCEGGLGGNNNRENKQLRFKMDKNPGSFKEPILEMTVLEPDNPTATETWTYEELIKIITIMTKILDDDLESNGGLKGFILIGEVN